MTSFAIITESELKAIAAAKVSGLSFMVYTALRTHSRNDENVVFPSIGRIKSILGDCYSKRSIHRALKSLATAKLIKVNAKTSKSRFVLLAMKVKEAMRTAADEVVTKWSHKKKPNSRNQNSKSIRPSKKQVRPFRPHKRKIEKRNYYIINNTRKLQKTTAANESGTSECPPAIANEVKKLFWGCLYGIGHPSSFGDENLSSRTIDEMRIWLENWKDSTGESYFGAENEAKSVDFLAQMEVRQRQNMEVK